MSERYHFNEPRALDDARARQTTLRIEVAELRRRQAQGLLRKEHELGRLNKWIESRQAAAHAATDQSLLDRTLRYLDAKKALGEEIGKDGERLAEEIRRRLPDWYRKDER